MAQSITRRNLLAAAAAATLLPRRARAGAAPSRYYYLGPWVWDTADGGHWRPPDGTLGAIDLRSLPQCAATVTPQGCGFFATDRPLGTDYQQFATTLDASLGAIARNRWKTQLGIPLIVPIQGPTLLDVLHQTLQLAADPDGQSLCPPLMPTHRGQLELHLGGHGMPWGRVFAGVDDAGWPRLKILLARHYLSLREQALASGTLLHRKWLACMVRKLRVPWQKIGDESPVEPTTTIADDFNRADADPISNSAAGWAWTEVAGSDWKIKSTSAVFDTGGTSQYYHLLRAESGLSSDDHYAEARVSKGTLTNPSGVSARFASSSSACYVGEIYWYGDLLRIAKFSPRTQLATQACGNATSATIRLTCDGSSLSLTDGTATASVTDTSITANVRTGLNCFDPLSTFDDFSAADLVAGGSAVPAIMNSYRQRR